MKKRVLHIVSTLSRGGGVEQVIFNLVKSLNSENYESIVCCLQDRGDLGEELKNSGTQILMLGMSKTLSFTAMFINIRAFFRLINLIKILKIDIVQTHEFFSGTIGRVAAWCARARVILLVLHNKDKWKKWHHVFIDKCLAKLTHMIIVNSNAVREFTVDYEKIAQQKFRVIHNGIDLEKFPHFDSSQCKQRLGVDTDSIIIGSVGRLAKQKGYEYLISALPSVLLEFPECKMVIVGGDTVIPKESAKEDITGLINRFGISDKVILTGVRKDVPELIAAFDIFILPSIFEGFGISIVEAMAMGKPVIASDVDGIPEVVDDGVTGVLVPPKDIGALARALTLLLRDKVKAKIMGEAGRERAKKLFTSKIMARKYEEIYTSLLTKNVA